MSEAVYCPIAGRKCVEFGSCIEATSRKEAMADCADGFNIAAKSADLVYCGITVKESHAARLALQELLKDQEALHE